MNDSLRTLYAFNHGYCESLLADISEKEMITQPTPGVNTPAWLLGHLAICTDSALGLMEREKRLPKTWRVYFGPGTAPTPGERTWPSKQELWDAYSVGHEAVDAASHTVPVELLAQPNPLDFLSASLPTVGDLLAHLMATHESMHLGHLSNWRRQTGRPPLF